MLITLEGFQVEQIYRKLKRNPKLPRTSVFIGLQVVTVKLTSIVLYGSRFEISMLLSLLKESNIDKSF